jgi:hypothetical protein
MLCGSLGAHQDLSTLLTTVVKVFDGAMEQRYPYA